jgi:ribosomal protein S18 acetylase RimI-like enzyme
MSEVVVIRPATPADLPDLRRGVVELQEHERRLHATRLPGEQIADVYIAWLQEQAENKSGVMMVAEIGGSFAGFAVGWIAQHHNIPETADANRFGYLSDICVMPSHRGQRIAHQLLAAIEQISAAPASRACALALWPRMRQRVRATRAPGSRRTRSFTRSSLANRTSPAHEPVRPDQLALAAGARRGRRRA